MAGVRTSFAQTEGTKSFHDQHQLKECPFPISKFRLSTYVLRAQFLEVVPSKDFIFEVELKQLR